MPVSDTRNLHVPLPDDLYRRLREEADRSGRPATALAREAIDEWLAARQAEAVHEAIAEYARQAGGSIEDLDHDLEQAGVDHLREALREPDERGS
jgi:predicted transcriptional regulator